MSSVTIDNSRQRRRYASVMAAVFILFAIRVFFSADLVSNFVLNLINPISNVFGRLQFDQSKAVPFTDEELAGLRTAEIEKLLDENQTLRNQLGFLTAQNYNGVGADVVGKNVEAYRKTVRINRGSEAGIKRDMPVLVEGFLVGIVNEVYEDSASILLISDPDFRAAVVIEGSDLSGLVTSNSGGIVVDRIPTAAEDIENKRIVTSGLGGLFPTGLVVGVVGSRLSDDQAVLHSYAVKTPIKVDFLNNVVVLTEL